MVKQTAAFRLTIGAATLVVAILAVSASTTAAAKSWASGVDGDWNDAARWAPAGVPTVADTASFPWPTAYRIDLPSGTNTPIASIDATAGAITFRAVGPTDATLSVADDLTLSGNNARFDHLATGRLQLVIGDTLQVGAGAEVIADVSQLSAAATVVEAGVGTLISRLSLIEVPNASLGAVSLGESGTSGGTSVLAWQGGTTGGVDDVSLGHTGTASRTEFQLDGATLAQSSAATTRVGRDAADSSRHSLFLGSGSDATLGDTTVHATGTLLSLDSALTLASDLTLAGGRYRRLGASTLTLAGDSTISVQQGAEFLHGGDPLTLTGDQTLAIGGDSLAETAGLTLDGGMLRFDPGASQLVSAVELQPNGRVVVDSQAESTVVGAFRNLGGDFVVHPGGEVRFEGAYEGAGATGGGSVVFLDSVSPGQSPGVASFGGDIRWESASRFVTQIAGPTPSEHDTVVAAGVATLDGTLIVELLPSTPGGADYAPTAGDAFTVLTAGALGGAFSEVIAPSLAGPLEWRLDPTDETLTLRVVNAGPTGDYNHDGVVNAADFTVWRDAEGRSGPLLSADGDSDESIGPDDYAIWSAAYGAASPSIAVPEPVSRQVLVTALLAWLTAGALGGPRNLVRSWGSP